MQVYIKNANIFSNRGLCAKNFLSVGQNTSNYKIRIYIRCIKIYSGLKENESIFI